MDRPEKPANDKALEELERLGAERRPIAAWLGKLEELRAEVSRGVFDRVKSDYEGRLAGIDQRAAPLVHEARARVAAIDSEHDRLDGERRGLDLDLQELALRHSLAELTDDELAERNRAPRERIAAIAEELERAKASRERWRSAIEQGFAAEGGKAEASRPAAPRVEAPPAAPAPGTSAPPAPAEEPRRVDITMPQPIPPPRPSSPAVPLPGPAVVEAARREASVVPVAPPAPTEAAGRTAYFSPAPPPPPAPPKPPAPAAPAADVAGRTSHFVPAPPPPPPPPPAAEAGGRTALFSPAPPPERTVVFGSVPPPLAAPAASVPKARLVAVESTGGAAKEYPLAAENTLGRVPENSIPVPHGSVSRHHATLRYADGAWSIVDQKSENGTWVNGERVSERKLANDDRINIGTVRFRFKID